MGTDKILLRLVSVARNGARGDSARVRSVCKRNVPMLRISFMEDPITRSVQMPH